MKKVERKALQLAWEALKNGAVDVHYCSDFFGCSRKHAYTIVRYALDAGWIRNYHYPLCPTTVLGVTAEGAKIIAEMRAKKSQVKALTSASLMPQNPRHDLLVLRTACLVARSLEKSIKSITTARVIRASSGAYKSNMAGGTIVPDAVLALDDGQRIAIEVQENAESDDVAERRLYVYSDLIIQGNIDAVIWASSLRKITAQLARIIDSGVRPWIREKKLLRRADEATGATAQTIDVWRPADVIRTPPKRQVAIDIKAFRSDYYSDIRAHDATPRFT